MPDDLRIHCAGEAALIVYLGENSSPEVSARVQSLGDVLSRNLRDVLVDLVPSYASLLVLFDPLRCDHYHVSQVIRDCAGELADTRQSEGKLIEIPVYYHPESGDDLESLAAQKGMTWEELAAIHSGQEYRVYAIGFAPGFAYLGDVDPRIAAPRLSTPRQAVPRGAVAIADRQTAVYPATSPGGWNLIGRSALRMFDPRSDKPMPVQVGDRVRFTPIDRADYLASGGEL